MILGAGTRVCAKGADQCRERDHRSARHVARSQAPMVQSSPGGPGESTRCGYVRRSAGKFSAVTPTRRLLETADAEPTGVKSTGPGFCCAVSATPNTPSLPPGVLAGIVELTEHEPDASAAADLIPRGDHAHSLRLSAVAAMNDGATCRRGARRDANADCAVAAIAVSGATHRARRRHARRRSVAEIRSQRIPAPPVMWVVRNRRSKAVASRRGRGPPSLRASPRASART